MDLAETKASEGEVLRQRLQIQETDSKGLNKRITHIGDISN